MTSLVISDFRLGVDRRRKRVSGAPGSIWIGKNMHLTRGGDVQKRKKMVEVYELPSNTFGFKKTSRAAYTFGSEPDGSVTVPSGVTYQRLASPSPLAPEIAALNEAIMFDGKVYAIATFEDGNTHHFYDGSRVTAWDDGVVRSYHSALSEIASQIANLINANSSEACTAAVGGNVITLTAKANDDPLDVTAEAENGGSVNDQTATVLIAQASGGGLPEITTVTLGGSLDVGDRFMVKIGNNQYGAGDNPATVAKRAITYGNKIYFYGNGSIVVFCSVDDPLTVRSGINGASFFNVSNQEEGSLDVVDAARYENGLAFFANDSVQLWTLDPDPAQNAISRTLENTGAIAERSALSFGNNDTFYLSRSGSRSVRSRDVNGAPFVSDIGNLIDALLIEDMRTIGAVVTAGARAAMELVDGRYMLALGDKIYVLSYFPGSKITGWSWYEIEEVEDFSVDWISAAAGQLYIRSGNKVYLYGGLDGATYDEDEGDAYEVKVGLPFLGGKRATEDKVLESWDCALENEWLIEVLVDPRDEARKVTLGRTDECSFADMDLPAQIDGQMFALDFTCRSPGPATISNFALTFE